MLTTILVMLLVGIISTGIIVAIFEITATRALRSVLIVPANEKPGKWVGDRKYLKVIREN
jgi:hypothetical protein